ncbi:MbnP family copper-binding protein [Ketogulonicigenium vulgare]|uniref:MbnP family copper-binding protein n=1 Tax=Ketogulonicigenium vulgare TaxID=92945 RepID=UPI002359A91B|nr:MbnP family copper-binding protein [Ketogulonicigenium vulgare]
MKSAYFAALLAATAVPALAEQPVTLNFVAEIGGAAFDCSQSYDHLGATHAQMNVTDFRLFVQDAALIRADGSQQPITLTANDWQHENVTLLDFENGAGHCAGTGNAPMNTVISGEVPEGDYIGVSLTLGVPFALNHIDPTLASAPLNTTGMFWTWQNGFRFLRIDFAPAGGTPMAHEGHGGHSDHGNASGWYLHLGSTQCAAASQTEAPSACVFPNRTTASFTSFDPATQVIVVDPAPVLRDADVTVNAPDTSPGCMSFPGDADCDSVIPKLGLAYGAHPAEAQQLFSIR